MKVKQLRTEYVQVWSVSRCLLLGERKNPQKSISLLSVFVFPSVNVFLEGDRDGSWWKPFIFLDEAGFTLAMTWRRGWEPSGWEGPRTMFSVGPDHPPTECDFEGTHKKNSAMGPEFLAMALRAIMVSVYHLVFTPILLFPYCNPTEEFFSTWRWKVHNRLLTNNLSSPGHRWCTQWPMSGLYLPCQNMFSPKMLMKTSIMMWMRTCGQTHKTGLIKT